jgi:hypothetical protein
MNIASIFMNTDNYECLGSDRGALAVVLGGELEFPRIRDWLEMLAKRSLLTKCKIQPSKNLTIRVNLGVLLLLEP